MPRPDTSKALAYLYEIRPLPMLATLLAAALGFLYAGGANYNLFAAYLVTVASALYCGHVIDSLVDYHIRNEKKYVYMGIFEDSGGLLSAKELFAAALLVSLVFLSVLLSIATFGSQLFWVSALGWLIAVTYSPFLDKNPVTVSLAYPLGTTLAFVGGCLLAGSLEPRALFVAMPILLYLLGGKIVSDLIDYKDDKKSGKRTVVVALGRNTGKHVGYLLSLLGLVVAVAAVILKLLPLTSLLGIVVASALLYESYRMELPDSVLVLVAGGYVFLAVTIVSLL